MGRVVEETQPRSVAINSPAMPFTGAWMHARRIAAVLVCCSNICMGGKVPTIKFEEAANGEWSPKSPMSSARVFVDNSTFGKSTVRGGFVYPRYDARLHDGDEIQLESIHSTWMHVSSHPLYTLRGRTVAFKASDGRFCAMDTDSDHAVRCDQDTPPFSAWFE